MAKARSRAAAIAEQAEALTSERRLRGLRVENAGLRQDNAALHAQIDLLERQLDLQAALKLAEPPNNWQRRKRAEKGRATVELLLSDWHVDEVIDSERVAGLNEWNQSVADAAIQSLVDRSLNLIDIERRLVALPDCVVWLGGDFISGIIHDELKATNSMSPPEAVVWIKPRIEGVLRSLLKHGKFERMLVVCSFGNHARITQRIEYKLQARNSYEWWMYQELASRFDGDDRVTFHVPESYDTVVQVEGHAVSYEHGHHHKFGGGIGGPLIPVNRAVGRRNSHARTRSDFQRLGHFHSHGALGGVVMNSSLIGYSEYLKGSFTYQRPSQTLCIIDPRHGQTLVREVFCR